MRIRSLIAALEEYRVISGKKQEVLEQAILPPIPFQFTDCPKAPRTIVCMVTILNNKYSNVF